MGLEIYPHTAQLLFHPDEPFITVDNDETTVKLDQTHHGLTTIVSELYTVIEPLQIKILFFPRPNNN